MITRLTPDTPENIQHIGGKGCGLIRLLKAGLPVPDAWCLPADTYLDNNGTVSADLKKDLTAFWDSLLATDPDIKLAVRSSATAEDLAEASFAGIYETRLGIRGPQALTESVQTCWDALNRVQAEAYRKDKQFTDTPAIALIIQKLIDPQTAGVLLTVNPQNPFTDQYVINASWGLGESVVSGAVDPDYYVLCAQSGKTLTNRIGNKTMAYRSDDDSGMIECPLDADKASELCLQKNNLSALHQLARTVERNIGPAQDIEWAIKDDRLYALQVRPITGLPPRNPQNVFSRRFGGEYLADYAMPLSNTMLVRWISENYFQEIAQLQGRRDLVNMEAIYNYEGYAYINGTYIARMLRFVPKGSRTLESIPWFPPCWNKKIMAEPFEPWRLPGIIMAVFRDNKRAPIHKNEAALQAHCNRIEKDILPKLNQDYRRLSQDEWRRQFDEVDAFGQEHFRVIRWGVGFHNPALHGFLAKLLAQWADDTSGDLYQQIISGLPGTRTAEINKDIWLLGKIARGDAVLTKRLKAKELDYDTLRREVSDAPFWGAFDRFIDNHGHRAATREISQPRWRETPEVILSFVNAQLFAPELPQDPDILTAKSEQTRRAAEATALRIVSRGLGGRLRRRFLAWLIKKTQNYTIYRENQRYHLDYLLTHMRTLILEQGRRFTEAGVLATDQDIFFLEKDEFWRLFDAPQPDEAVTRKIEERREHFNKWHHRLPATYLYDGIETEGEPDDGEAAAVVSDFSGGMGASRGEATGKARIITHISGLDAIETGDILVAGNIDPGWTNVFPMISGLVTETGGLLSHGALLAREYGIPAVMGIKDATKLITNNDVLTINGQTGAIIRKEKGDFYEGIKKRPILFP